MRIQAIKPIRVKGVEYKPGEELEISDLFGQSFIDRGMAELVKEKKSKPKVK